MSQTPEGFIVFGYKGNVKVPNAKDRNRVDNLTEGLKNVKGGKNRYFCDVDYATKWTKRCVDRLLFHNVIRYVFF